MRKKEKIMSRRFLEIVLYHTKNLTNCKSDTASTCQSIGFWTSINCHIVYYRRKQALLGLLLVLHLDLDTPSSLNLGSELTDSLDLDLDIDREQLAEVAVWSKLARDVMLDLLRPISTSGVMS